MSKIKILILASNPIQTGRLRIDFEVRKIENGIKQSKYRDNIEIISKWAVTSDEFRKALLEVKPTILHFTGHGAGNTPSEYLTGNTNRDIEFEEQNTANKSCLVIETDNGSNNFLNPEALSDLISMFKTDIKCVVLNACHSQYQAELFSKNIDYAIGTQTAVPDDSAIAFSEAFYEAIGNGENIPFAFDFAKNNISLKNLNGKEIPKLNINQRISTHNSLIILEEQPEVKKKEKIVVEKKDFDVSSILDGFIKKQVESKKKLIDMQIKLIDQYQDKLVLEEDPKRIMLYEKELEKLFTTKQKYENEIVELMNQVSINEQGKGDIQIGSSGQSFKSKIENLIASANIESAISETLNLLNKNNENDLADNMRLLSARFNSVKNDKLNNLISYDEYKREIAIITNSFQKFFKEIPENLLKN